MSKKYPFHRKAIALWLLCLLTAALPATAQDVTQLKRTWDECFRRSVASSRDSARVMVLWQQRANGLADSTSLTGAAQAYLTLSDDLMQQGEHLAALQLALQLKADLTPYEKQPGVRAFLVRCNNRVGLNYCRLGSTDRAMSYYKEAEQLLQQSPDPSLEWKTLNNISQIYYQRHNLAKSIELQRQALDILLTLRDNAEEIGAHYNNLGIIYLEQGDYAQALTNVQKAMEQWQRTGSDYLMYGYANLGAILNAQGRYAEAERQLGHSMALWQGKSFDIDMLDTRIEMAKAKVKLRKTADFIEIKSGLLSDISNLSSAEFRQKGLSQLANLCFFTGDSVQGAKLLITANKLRDSLQLANDNYLLQQLLVAYDTEQLQHRNQQLEQSLTVMQLRGRTRTYIIIFISIILALATVTIALLIKKNQNARIMHEQQKQLRHYEQEAHERKERDLQNSIDLRNRRLTEYAIDLGAINDFHQQIDQRILQVLNTHPPLSDEARQMLQEASGELKHFNDKRLSEDFHTYFEQVSPHFLRQLKAHFPQLSQNDIRMCAYLHLGLSTKEIASLTFREVRSIETTRLRLRKKLGLPPGASLQEFLAQFDLP